MDEQTKRILIGPFLQRTNRLSGELVQRLRDDEALPHVARFGDGEMFCCLNSHPLASFAENCDKHLYSEDLATALLESLRKFVATRDLWLGNWFSWPFGAWLHGIVDSFGGQRQWCSHNLFAHIVRKRCEPPEHVDWKKLEPVRDLYLAIRASPRRKVLVVRPGLGRLQRFFGKAVHVPVPPINGWKQYTNVLARTRKVVQPRDVVLIAFGMPAKPLMAAMLDDQPEATYFDVGSGMDCLVREPRTRSCRPRFSDANKLYSELLSR